VLRYSDFEFVNMSFFVCTNCGYGSASWMGKCPDCGKWNTIKERNDLDQRSSKKKESLKKISITPLKKIKSTFSSRKKTGLFELDRVLGDGFVKGEVILLTGEPGIGKSTLVLQALKKINTLYISGEESGEQVKGRADRLKIDLDNFLFSNDLQIEGIIEAAKELSEKIDIVVIDSIQTIYSKDIEGNAASISQLKGVTKQLIAFAKKSGIAVLIIGHINKEGEVAGPKTLEHFVDCVLNFEGEKVSNYRMLRASKNRFGNTDEIGIFEMSNQGLKQVNDPLVFVKQDKNPSLGKAVVGINQGQRPLFFEIQTLSAYSALAYPRRIVKGLDLNKVQLMIAVIQKYLHLSLDKYDIYVNVIGGVSIKSPAADLGLIASIVSSFKNIPLPNGSLFVGEVGLLGEIRKVYLEEKITAEAKRLGFKKIFSSKNMASVKGLPNTFK